MITPPEKENELLILRIVTVLLWRELQRDRGLPIDEVTQDLHRDLLRHARCAIGDIHP
jgi:hypothetical protein